jgi:hypothetical protein
VYEALPRCDSYCVTPEAARRLADAFLPVRYQTNMHLTYLAAAADLPWLLSRRNVLLDGSKFGAFVSTLTHNNKLFLNREFMRARAILARGDGGGDEPASTGELQEAADAIAAAPDPSHPDFLYLGAKLAMRREGAAAAMSAFEAARMAYDAKGCAMDSDSEFLRDYIRLYMHLQD